MGRRINWSGEEKSYYNTTSGTKDLDKEYQTNKMASYKRKTLAASRHSVGHGSFQGTPKKLSASDYNPKSTKKGSYVSNSNYKTRSGGKLSVSGVSR